ncbi:MAG: DegT/DnrJ/EryC1/StrS family aminotransferase [Patescibacteria group bacterium]
MNNYPLAKPYLGKAEEQAATEVLRSGILSIGSKVREFEKQFAKKIGTKYACAVSSGTAGLHLTMIAAGIGPGDEVITTPFSFIASANCIIYVGAKPVFVDIDPQTYNIDPQKIEAKITKRTKAIVVVHIFGQSADMESIMAIAKKYKLKIIEDACESIAAQYQGKRTGTFGESAVFAFYPNKQMTTGEGGMIATDSKKIYELCCSLRNQGRSENMQWLDHQLLGYNYRLDEMSAAIGLVQLKKLDSMIKERQKIAAWYSAGFAKHKAIIQAPVIAAGNTHTWFVYVVKILPGNIKRDKIIELLAKERIAAKPYLPSIHLFDFYKKQFNYREGDYRVAENMSQKSLALPFYLGLKKSDISYIISKLITILKSYEKRV